MTDVHYREAERLIQQRGVRRSLRTLDAASTLRRPHPSPACGPGCLRLCRPGLPCGSGRRLHIINP
jgi:hypothetical protein